MRNTFDAMDTYDRGLKDLSQQIGVSMNAAMNIYSPLIPHYSYRVSKHIT